MKFFLPALIAGIVLNFFVLSPGTGTEVRARWTGTIKEVAGLERSGEPAGKETLFAVWTADKTIFLDGNGGTAGELDSPDSILALSGGGAYAARFEKIGSSVELLNWKGARFWKEKSMEYPSLSYNCRLVFLMNADHSRIRILDYNGNEIGDKYISGKFCTAVAFSSPGDNGAAGFLDGTYYFIDEKGKRAYSGSVGSGKTVKSIAVSSGGRYGAVHYGDTARDFVDIVNIADKETGTLPLSGVHYVRIGMHVSDAGRVTFLDEDRIVQADDDGDVRFSIRVKPVRAGYSGVQFSGGFYGAHYTMKNGEAFFLLFNEDGDRVMEKEFPSESFLQCTMKNGLILLRGSDGLYCYSVNRPQPR